VLIALILHFYSLRLGYAVKAFQGAFHLILPISDEENKWTS